MNGLEPRTSGVRSDHCPLHLKHLPKHGTIDPVVVTGLEPFDALKLHFEV